MPIDYQTIKTTLMTMKENINQMHVLVEHHERGTGTIGDVVLTYDDAQKQALIDRYNAIKTELQATYQQLQ